MWRHLPDVSQWVLRTVRYGYTIQFWKGPPPLSGALPTTAHLWEVLVLSQESEEIPLAQTESGFHRRYFVVPKKDGGLCPIFGLVSFKFCTQGEQFQDANDEVHFVSYQTRRLVCNHQSKGCILSHLDRQETQKVLQIHFQCSSTLTASGSSNIHKVYGF